MAQPTEYVRQFSFLNHQASNPDEPLPAASLEAELNAVKLVLDQIRANLARIQRDDGELANLSVGTDQLSVQLLTGINPPTVWTAAPTAYVVGDTVVYIDEGRSELWRIDEAHTSTTDFDADAAAYMTQMADFSAALNTAAGTTFNDTGNTYATGASVQEALDAVEARLLQLVIGTHIQAQNARLSDVAGLTPADGNVIVGNGTNFVAESGETARTSLGMNGRIVAWVRFTGSGTVAIQASQNVASVTDLGVGQYQVNFTTALASTNYSAVATSSNIRMVEVHTPLTTSVRVSTRGVNEALADSDTINVQVVM